MNDHLFARPDRVATHRQGGADKADLYVLCMVYNPVRFRSRWKLAEDFFRWIKQAPGTILCVAEVAHGLREFVLNDGPTPIDVYLPLQTDSELWLKENAMNLLMSRLPHAAQYLAFMDADIKLVRDDWANETVQLLQHYDVIQMWREAMDLGPDNTTIMRHWSFVHSWTQRVPPPPTGGYYGPPGQKPSAYHWHPGFCWAWRRQAIHDVGGLIDVGILGANDNHMAHSLIGNGMHSVHPAIKGGYRELIGSWQSRALRYLRRNIGCMDSALLHYWHGAKAKRLYWDRWKILVNNHYNPYYDLKRDWQGLYRLEVRSLRQEKIRDQIRYYFRQRDEDATSE